MGNVIKVHACTGTYCKHDYEADVEDMKASYRFEYIF